MISVELSTCHYKFMNETSAGTMHYTDTVPKYYEAMRFIISTEIKMMVRSRDSIYNGVLSLYIGSPALNEFTKNLFNTESMMTPGVIGMAWSHGNLGILQSCITLGLDLEPQKNISGSIRSGNTEIVDLCVSLGANLNLPLLPYRHCKTVEMVNHLFYTHQCKLHDMKIKISSKHLVNVEYVYLGGHIDELGSLNESMWKRGNWDRSIPIRVAYMRLIKDESIEPDGLAKIVSLPGSIVDYITTYL